MWLLHLGQQFQSTFPRGERPICPERILLLRNFNPRSHEGNDGVYSGFPSTFMSFQSTFPRGERRCFQCRPYLFRGFQSTFPRGERRSASSLLSPFCLFQSTFPRGERHLKTCVNLAITIISIHVPTRGTTANNAANTAQQVFQSTFPRGERPRRFYSFFIFFVFQSTFPRGERRLS